MGLRDLDDGHVDAIERRAAHDAGDSHWRFNSRCNSASSCSASMGRSSSRFSSRMRSAMPYPTRLEQLDLHRLGALRLQLALR